MNAYSVTGTYAYTTPDGWEGSGQAPAATVEARTASEAAAFYRLTDVALALALRPGCENFTDVRSNVCAVAITGPPDVFSDPL